MNYPIFTSESVCAGHPDKVCDQISDAILDAALAADPMAHTAVESLATKNHLTLAGEIKVKDGIKIPFEEIARNVVRELGYTDPEYNFDADNVKILSLIHQQSPDIAMGVDSGGAGDQGMMFGYAANETPSLMPLPITLAHELAKTMDETKKGKLTYLKPDGKTEVAVKYENGKPVEIEGVVLAVPHKENVTNEQIKEDLYNEVVEPVLTKYGFTFPKEKIVVNGTGRWIVPGPASDTGLTGRKIVVDAYGGMGRAGGGAFSGKEPSKVDRGAAYAARYVAKNIVAAGLADRAEVQIAYVIGHRDPLTKSIETFGTEKVSMKAIEDFAWNLLDLSVQGIIEGLDLRRPIYKQTAAYGHFGREIFPWEKTVASDSKTKAASAPAIALD